MTRISDVAREAGVSAATVSRVLNGNPSVDGVLAERVREAAARLGYRPNSVARSLRRQSTDVIALIISDVGNPFFTAVTRGVEDVANRSGYSVLLCNADENPDKEATYLRVVQQHQVAGVILSPHAAGSDVSKLAEVGIPLVVIDRPLHVPADSVMVMSTAGARQATDHLIDEGWRRPACITGPEDAATAEERLNGYVQAIEAVPSMTPIFRRGQFRQRDGAAATADLLDSAEPPDALFVANAELALGVLSELRRRGVRLGVDVGLVMFDDTPWAPVVTPAVSVVAQPAYDIGTQAAELLVGRIRGEAPAAPRALLLSTTLIARESSRRLPNPAPA